MRSVHPDDLPLVMNLFTQAEQHPIAGAEGTFRRYRLSGKPMRMRMRMKVFFLRHEQERGIFLATLADVTETTGCDGRASLATYSDLP